VRSIAFVNSNSAAFQLVRKTGKTKVALSLDCNEVGKGLPECKSLFLPALGFEIVTQTASHFS